MQFVRTRLIVILAAIGAFLAQLAPLHAHEVRPAMFRITERADGHFEVLLKQPTMGVRAVRLIPRINGDVLDSAPDSVEATNSYQVSVWRDLSIADGIDGKRVEIEGLERTITDAMVLITLMDGRQQQALLGPSNTSMVVDLSRNGISVNAYLLEGIKHILGGIDHLAFVLGLMLLIPGNVMLVKAVTAFTVAHSLTLAATSLGLVGTDVAVIEPLVALSIVFIAVEVVYAYQNRAGLTTRSPWLIAFGFGLLHGFAFAGALTELGLPKDAVVTALFLFNVGVEIGQLLFVALMLLVMKCLTLFPGIVLPWTRWLPPYAIGSCAVFWLLERTQASMQIQSFL